MLLELQTAIQSYEEPAKQSKEDDAILKAEMSLKQMNLRFEMLKRDVSPTLLVAKTRNDKSQDRLKMPKSQVSLQSNGVPIFEASLFQSREDHPERKISKSPLRHSANIAAKKLTIQTKEPMLSSRIEPSVLSKSQPRVQPERQEHKEKPLMTVRVKVKADTYVNAHVYRDDTSQRVADRVYRHAHVLPTRLNKEKRYLLAQYIEREVNAYIHKIKEDTERDQRTLNKQRQQADKIEREKRLHEASSKSIINLNTAVRMRQKEDNKARVLGKLSISIGSHRRGDIVVREDENLHLLAKSFVASYGLKKEFIETIRRSLEQLHDRYAHRASTYHRRDASIEEQELKISSADISTSTLENPLFRLNFELGDGASAKLAVREGDDFGHLARQFVAEHLLDEAATEKVHQLIAHTY